MPITLGQGALSDRSIIIRPSGDVAADMAVVNDAVTQLNTWGKGTLWIDGMLEIDTFLDFTAPISLRGMHKSGCGIKSLTNSYPVRWNNAFTGAPTSNFAFSMSGSFSERFTPLGGTVAKDDWVMLWSNDAINHLPHVPTTGEQRPQELHRAYHVLTGGDVIVDSFIVDEMTTSARYGVMNMARGYIIDNLQFSFDESIVPDDFSAFLTIKESSDVVIENCYFDRICGGGINLIGAGDVRIVGNSFNGINKVDGLYHVQATLSSNIIIADNYMLGSRHAFSTGSGRSSGDVRWGTPLSIKVDNNVIEAPPKAEPDGSAFGTAYIVLDTHAEGWGIEFTNNRINCGGDGSGGATAIQSRSRRTIIKGNTIEGYTVAGLGQGRGVRVFGEDTVVAHNQITRMNFGIITDLHSDGLAWCNDCEFTNNTIRDCQVPLTTTTGTGHTVVNNTIIPGP